MEATVFHLNIDIDNPDLDMIHNNLRRVFGKGAGIIERVIIEELYLRIGLDPKDARGRGFQDGVSYAKGVYSNQIVKASQLK
jgi:hypothetical protein